jgi:flagellar basal-body rod protein FlgC
MIQLLGGIESTAAALASERVRMDVISQNIANASTLRGPDGRPYQRQQVVFESVLRDRMSGGGSGPAGATAVRVARVEPDLRPPRLVYDPVRGPIEVPNINVHEEMADLISASRAFEANLAVLKTARSMAMQTLALGKR